LHSHPKTPLSAFLAIITDRCGCGPQSSGTPRSPERGWQRSRRFAHQAGGDQGSLVGILVVDGQWHNLRDRPVAVTYNDFFAGADFFQVLRQPVPQVRNVRTPHRTSNMAITAIIGDEWSSQRYPAQLIEQPPGFECGARESDSAAHRCETSGLRGGLPPSRAADVRGNA
jgi:hypothetical protein